MGRKLGAMATTESTSSISFKAEMDNINRKTQEATARFRKYVNDNYQAIAGNGRSVALPLSEQLHIAPKIIYRVLNENTEIVNERGETQLLPIKFNLNLDATRQLCYDIMGVSLHEFFFDEPTVSLIPAHLIPVALALKKLDFDTRASVCNDITALATSARFRKNRMTESSATEVFYRALDELYDDQYVFSIEQLDGYSTADTLRRSLLAEKALQRNKFRISEIMYLAKHQKTSVDRFVSDLYYDHTDLGILVDGSPMLLSKFDFFVFSTFKEYLSLNYKARKEILPILLRLSYQI